MWRQLQDMHEATCSRRRDGAKPYRVVYGNFRIAEPSALTQSASSRGFNVEQLGSESRRRPPLAASWSRVAHRIGRVFLVWRISQSCLCAWRLTTEWQSCKERWCMLWERITATCTFDHADITITELVSWPLSSPQPFRWRI